MIFEKVLACLAGLIDHAIEGTCQYLRLSVTLDFIVDTGFQFGNLLVKFFYSLAVYDTLADAVAVFIPDRSLILLSTLLHFDDQVIENCFSWLIAALVDISLDQLAMDVVRYFYLASVVGFNTFDINFFGQGSGVWK